MAKLPGISVDDLQYYIKNTLIPWNLWSKSAENLLLGTCAQESLMGRFVIQMGGGPARGIFQMEPTTYMSIIEESDICRRRGIKLPDNVRNLVYDINSAILAARLKYSMIPEKLPEYNDLDGLAHYWKKYYNTRLGKGTEEEFIRSYKRYIGE